MTIELFEIPANAEARITPLRELKPVIRGRVLAMAQTLERSSSLLTRVESIFIVQREMGLLKGDVRPQCSRCENRVEFVDELYCEECR